MAGKYDALFEDAAPSAGGDKYAGLFDDDAQAAPAAVDMSPAARRARAGMAQGPRDLTAEQAGTSPGPIKTDAAHGVGRVGLASTSQEPAPADLPPDQRVSVVRADNWRRRLGQSGIPSTGTRITAGPETGEMADPLVQMGTATALGMAAGAGVTGLAGAAGLPRLGALAAPVAESVTATKALGGDLKEGVALGLLPAVPALARGVGAVAQKLAPNAEKAIKNARGWVAKDISGDVKGASTATARKQLADDADNVSRLVLKDRKLDKAIDRAGSGNLDELNAAQEMVQQRLKAVEAERLAPHWDAATKALPGGGVRSGDVTNFLTTRIDDLRATGLTSEAAEADALEGILGRIQKAKAWGGGAAKFDPAAKVQGGALDGMEAGKAIALLEKSKTAGTAASIDEQIAAMRKAATTTGFNPNTIVPARQVQKQWADEAGIAYKSMGGIHGTVAFERKLDVAAHLREFRDDMLAKAAQGDPAAVAQIRAANRDYSALKRIENVLDQRVNNAKANAGGASVPAGFKRSVEKFKQSPTGFTLGLVPDALIGGKRRFDKWIARGALDRQQITAVRNIFESKAKPGRGVQLAVAAGVPSSVARWAAEAADAGVTITDAGGDDSTMAEAAP